MSAVSRVAIVGSGVAGTAAAILLAEGGVEVDVFEAKPDLSALGSGITLQGNALRVFDRLGVWEQVKEAGYSFDLLGLRAPGPDAPVIAQIPDAPTGGPEYPAIAGMYRPDLARILADRATELGARIHYGTTVTGFTQDADGVDVTLSDGSTGRYDLLIGADGLHSDIRKQLGIEVEPAAHGHGHLARLRAAPEGRHAHRPLLRRPGLHRRVLPDERGDDVRVPRRARAGPAPALARGGRRGDEGAVAGVRRPVERDPRVTSTRPRA